MIYWIDGRLIPNLKSRLLEIREIMSDYRDTSTKNRRAFNFSVAIKTKEGKLEYNNDGCGYVNSLSTIVKRPNKPRKFDLV
jgi:hypothetical protein